MIKINEKGFKCNVEKLIIASGYSKDSILYRRSYHISKYFKSFSSGIDYYYIRDSREIPPHSVRCSGEDFEVGLLPKFNAIDEFTGITSSWSPQQSERLIYRDLQFFKFLLQNYTEKFWLYCHTITSLVDYISLANFLNDIECKNFYGGFPNILENKGYFSDPSFPGRIKIPKIGSQNFLLYTSGAGILLSSDLLALILEREAMCSHQVPNDIWMSVILSDCERSYLPRVDVGASEINLSNALSQIASQKMIDALLENGHFHFRVNSLSKMKNASLRSIHDPLIMAGIANSLVNSQVKRGSPLSLGLKNHQTYRKLFGGSEKYFSTW